MGDRHAGGRLRRLRRQGTGKLLAIFAGPGLLLAVGGVFVVAFLVAAVPLPRDIVAGPTRVLDRNGVEVGTLTAQAPRRDVDLAALPDHVPQAVLAAEDRNFYDHGGVSVRGIVRALFTNVRAGEIEQGGSTITQQYIKNAALGSERTFRRKLKEAILALKMERQYSKEQILTFYLNSIYWGRGAYGVEAAAATYFRKPAGELTLNEAATLAGIIRTPEHLDPAEHPEAAEARRRYTLEGMAEQGWITREVAAETVAGGLPDVSNRQRAAYTSSPYYLDAVRRELTAELGEDAALRGLVVVTEMDVHMQRAAEAAVRDNLATLRDRVPDDLVPDEQLTGAIVSVDPADGGIRALVGGGDFSTQPFNTAVQGGNQAGSAFKPFGLAAFVDEGYSPESRFPAPGEMTVEFGAQDYRVQNFGGRGYGTQTVREATLTSTNVVYVQMAAEVGPQRVKDTAVTAGIRDDVEAVPSLVLGTADVGVVEMAGAYATFAAGGVRTDPRLIREIRDPDGAVLLRNEPQPQGAIAANVAYVVSDILERNVTSGTGTRAQIGRPAAGKTGTTQDSQDAWFVGYVPQLSTAVWFGTLDDSSMGDVTGGSIPAETWGTYMSAAVKDLEVVDFPDPDLSDLEVLGGRRGDGDDEDPTPTQAPTTETTPSPTPTPTPCPEGVLPLPGGECPSPDGSPPPQPSPTPTPTPSPEPSSPPPSPEPTPSEQTSSPGLFAGNRSRSSPTPENTTPAPTPSP